MDGGSFFCSRPVSNGTQLPFFYAGIQAPFDRKNNFSQPGNPAEAGAARQGAGINIVSRVFSKVSSQQNPRYFLLIIQGERF